ncbi:alpha/beta hydrolase [Pigmentiphaga aceris]|uniref:Alpha/beta hydrolase n=2 Tax=Pigmentiphaga aceris TaxID=1940612 RepID=A0A5C0B4Z6_9BURK|nr:alpha/beta hydrolase [Pigmentiphaga aceris]
MTTPAVYQGMDRATLDAAYDNTRAVADSATLLADFERRSTDMRARPDARLDMRYGPAPRQRIDYFPASRPGPLLIFIHGGYWQMRAKETFSFLAAGPNAHGIHVAMIGYTLAPDTNMAGIVAEVRAGIRWLREHASAFGADVDKMVVSGWSAGGHLAAMCLDEDGICGGVAISGIFDLEPIRHCYLNEKLQLSQQDIDDFSPLTLPCVPKPLSICVGQAELLALQRQSLAFSRARHDYPGDTVLLPGHNHFSILYELSRADGALTMQVRALLR